MKKISMVINADDRLGHISPEIYGHFSEHLGRCIYNGIYVGENSPIPNTDGIRNDIIEALRNIKTPVFRWPGGLLCRRISLAGRYRRKISAPKDREHELGRSYGG